MVGTATMTKNISVGARAGGVERGGMGMSKPTFSSRSLAEFSRPTFRTSEMSAAGRKVAIGNEKMSLVPSGDIPRTVGLGDYANAGNLSGRHNEAPKTIKKTPTPTFVEFVPPPVEVTIPEIKKPSGENLLKTTRAFQIPFDAQPETRISDTVVKRQDILRELHEVSAAHHQKVREAESILQTKKRAHTKDGVLVEPIPGFDKLKEGKQTKVSEKPSTGFIYRTVLARKEAAKAAQNNDEVKTETKQKAKRNVKEVTKTIKNKFDKQLGKLAIALTPADKKVLPQKKRADNEPVTRYSVDTKAAAARLQQVIEAGQIVFNSTNQTEYISGSEVVSVMNGPTQATTSDIVRDYAKNENSHVTGIDGSDPEWRQDFSTRLVTAANLISEAIRVIRAKPPVQKGPGDSVSVEDSDRVKRMNFREIGRQI